MTDTTYALCVWDCGEWYCDMRSPAWHKISRRQAELEAEGVVTRVRA